MISYHPYKLVQHTIPYLKIHVLLTLVFILIGINSRAQYDKIKKTEQVFGLIQNYYADSVDFNVLNEAAVKAVLKELDPHSVYIKKEDLTDLNNLLKGNFIGIGIDLNLYNDSVLVTLVRNNTPAQKAGLIAGDIILSIDEKIVSGVQIPFQEIKNMIKGSQSSEFSMMVLHPFDTVPSELSIKRDKIDLNSIDAAYMINEETGYLKLNRFTAGSDRELKHELKELCKKKNAKNIILDLRKNGGGYLNKAVLIAGNFLKDSALIVYTEGVHSTHKKYYAHKDGIFEEGKLIVLIDERSASSSEILAGALQDWERATIVGRRSFGKGLVQRQFMLNDSSAIRLTIAHYYTPSGRSIQKPYTAEDEEYSTEISDRKISGELYCKDSIPLNDSLIYHTLINKNILYGGGGIIPDVFVPIDTGSCFEWGVLLWKEGIIERTASNYVFLLHQKKHKIGSAEDFINNFQINDEISSMMMNFINHKEGLDRSMIECTDQAFIHNLLKAAIGSRLYETQVYYQIRNQMDNDVKAALEIIETSAN